jgi:hypothetical protein
VPPIDNSCHSEGLCGFKLDAISVGYRLAGHLQALPAMAPKFIQPYCDRCDEELSEGRMMSFFSDETICLECSRKEEEIRKKIRQELGQDADLEYRGCGFLPKRTFLFSDGNQD